MPVRKHTTIKQIFRYMAAAVCAGSLFANSALMTLADTEDEIQQRWETQRAMEVQSNQVSGWPTGPIVGAESAILMEAETGAILYAKNIHTREYPASTTKLLTTLIASELCEMDEIVTFSRAAVFDTPRDSNHIAMDVGQELTMEQSLNAILIRSANEVSFAVAEHITGTTNWLDFAEMMNTRAAELGCLNSHFVNPNGLPDEEHYTTAYDLAMIGRAFFANEMLSKITLTRRLEIPASDKLPQQKLELNQMQLIPGAKYAYEYLVGCKTGYTQAARSCLVSCAERNGMKLICVVMRDKAPYQYEDTLALYEYGFSNFEKIKVAQSETKYNIDNTGLFYSGNDIFGSSRSLLSLNRDDYVILPISASFEDTESTISYETSNDNQAAVIFYTFQGVPVGSVRVNYTMGNEDTYVFDSIPGKTSTTPPEEKEQKEPVIYVNKTILLCIGGGICAIVLICFIVHIVTKNYSFSGVGNRRRRRRGRWKR